MSSQSRVRLTLTLQRHPLRMTVSEAERDRPWRISIKGADGYLGQLIPRRVEIKTGDSTRTGLVKIENSFAWFPSALVRVSGFNDYYVSREHRDLMRCVSVKGEDIGVYWDDVADEFSICYAGEPVARVRHEKGEELGTELYLMETEERYLLLGCCFITAVYLVAE